MTADLNPRFTFENLVVGASNRLAVAAAKSVADNPGTAHNPLFVYSDTGLGKTHLLTAVGIAARALIPDLVVEYLTLDDFVEALHDAVSAGRAEDVRRRFASVNLLLLDDVQFLAGRREMQEELLRLIAALQEGDAQVVLTCDRSPSEIADLDDRLLARIGGGLVIDIQPPDFETRLAILRRRADERGGDLSDAVLEVIARSDITNVRELIGILNRLIAFQAVSEAPLTAEAAVALLSGEGRDSGTRSEPEHGGDPEAADEFGSFLSGVTATLSEQVERLSGRVRDAIERWGGRGYRTDHLEAALEDGGADIEVTLRAFEEAVAELRALQYRMAECDPEQAGSELFRDPDRLEEARTVVEEAEQAFEPPPGPSEAFSLDAFLASGANRMALGAAQSIVEDPGTHYNPLVIVGGSGSGKTHLLHGIGHQLQGDDEGWVACVSAQTFSDQLVQAIEQNRVPAWRARYRRARAFLLDNIDLLGDRERVQEELFYLFNVLADGGRQLVFTSNAAPRDIEGLDERLVSRLEGGLLVELNIPDRELREAILRQQFDSRAGSADSALIEYLADQHAESVRSVLALGHRVLNTAEARGVTPDAALARSVLASERPAPAAAGKAAGVVVLPSGGVENPEKVVWEWPDPADWVIEELR